MDPHFKCQANKKYRTKLLFSRVVHIPQGKLHVRRVAEIQCLPMSACTNIQHIGPTLQQGPECTLYLHLQLEIELQLLKTPK